ncbi:CHAT domain-containing tetratricopeptide repeat protein [Spongiivirga sp. MCCC 1A20706]|uniref:CHAT domain-containing protein n=1 Tax=Spongiivirga sp. MCCC 1A20706 TaxID=3160963 RepID=UPI003977BA8A
MSKDQLLSYLLLLLTINVFSQTNNSTKDAQIEKVTELFYKGYDYMYVNKDSTYFYFDQALAINDSLKDIDTELQLHNYLIFVSGYFYDLPRFESSLQKVETILNSENAETSIVDYQLMKDQFTLDQGDYYYKLGDFERAKPKFLSLLKSYEQIPIKHHTKESIGNTISVYNYLAAIYYRQHKYDLAKQYYLKTGVLITDFYGDDIDGKSQLAANQRLLAALYNDKGDYQKANELLHESLTFYLQHIDKNDALKNSVNAVYQKLVENQLKQDSVVAALNTLNESQSFLVDENDPFYRSAQLLYGDIYLEQENFNQSKNFYTSALKAFQTYRNNLPHEDMANVYVKLALLEKRKENYTTALTNIQQALIHATPNFSNLDISSNPAIDEAFSKRQLLTVLSEKLAILDLSNEQEEYTHEVSYQIINTLDKLKTEFESKLDKTFLIDQTYPIFHKIIELAHKNFNKSKDTKYLELAFLAMEKSKSILLLETVKAAEATKFGEVPDSILNIGKQYRANINFYEKKLFDAQIEQRQSLNDSLFKWNNGYIHYLASVEKEYPKYYQLKYDTKTASIEDTKAFLNGSEKLINYHIGDSVLYAMVVSKKEVDLKAIPFNNDLNKKIEQFYRKIAAPALDGDIELQLLSNEIYSKILRPILNENSDSHLIIIPDGVLSYIPFGVLNKIDNGWSYVINDHSVRYASSATLMINPFQHGVNNVKNKLLAVAPTFNDASLYNLPFAKNEIDLVASHFDGTTMSGNKATLSNFTQTNNQYGLLHLATHASANDEFPDYSYLAFSSDKENGDKLYVKDLYNQTISANMVTLSACQTGIGRLQKGEGLLSIERGFMYAGAKSLTTTMWKNNDKTTSQLMNFYYGHLKKGTAKDIALQKAKQDYLATTTDDLLKHPYYWAGFKVIGDASPVSSNTYWLWVFALLASVSGIIIYRNFA